MIIHASDILVLGQILVIDLSLAADNALAVGMASAGLPKQQRRQVILVGMIAATSLRIIFAFFAVRILAITGLTAAGGMLLLWVAWKMYREIRQRPPDLAHENATSKIMLGKKRVDAIAQIVIADISMSLDNVLAVAGVARDHQALMIAGFAMSVFLMGVAASIIAPLTARYRWLAYLGVAVVLYTAIKMIHDGLGAFITP